MNKFIYNVGCLQFKYGTIKMEKFYLFVDNCLVELEFYVYNNTYEGGCEMI